MPNKRADNKIKIGAWLEDDLVEALKAEAERTGTTLSALIVEMAEDYVKKHPNINEKHTNQDGGADCP